MQDSIAYRYYCQKLLLNISELTSYKKGDEILHLKRG
jgi:hypothetical protein